MNLHSNAMSKCLVTRRLHTLTSRKIVARFFKRMFEDTEILFMLSIMESVIMSKENKQERKGKF